MGQTCCKAEENETNPTPVDNKVIEVGRPTANNNFLQENFENKSMGNPNSQHEPNEDIARLIPEDHMNQENNTVAGVMVERGVYRFMDSYADPSDAS